MVPMLVKNRIIVPSETGVPAGSMTIAVMTETPPSAATKGGFAMSVMVDPGGAVKSTSAQATAAASSAAAPAKRRSRAVIAPP